MAASSRMPITPVSCAHSTSAPMNVPSCSPRVRPQTSATSSGRSRRRHDAGVHRVLEVVGAVRDAVGPADDHAFGRGRRRPRPGVVADAVQRLAAQVQRDEDDVRAPDGVVVAARQERVEGLLAGVPARPVAAVVADRDGLGQRDVEPGGRGPPTVATWATSRAWVSRVRWWSAGKTKTWVLPARRRKAVECRIRSRSRSKQVRSASGCSGPGAVAGASGARGARLQQRVLALLPLLATEGRAGQQARLGDAVRPDDAVGAEVPGGGGRPGTRARGRRVVRRDAGRFGPAAAHDSTRVVT